MTGALAMSGLLPNKIDYINAHGTGTPNNDMSESIALERVFGKTPPKFSSTKAYTGHTLGASASIEAVFSILALQNNIVFPNLNFHTKIEEVSIVPQLDIEETKVDHVLSNSFGFGGNNSSIIFSKILYV
jgi:3-oxoacyl-[acyl-carrier-protein] synthase-1